MGGLRLAWAAEPLKLVSVGFSLATGSHGLASFWLGEATDAVPELTREWPLRVSFGRIGTFRLCVPWRRLFRPGAPLELVLGGEAVRGTCLLTRATAPRSRRVLVPCVEGAGWGGVRAARR